MFVHSKFVVGAGRPPRILLAKVDTKNTFRQVGVDVNQSSKFGFVFAMS